jgi:hypothetical protein
VPDTAAASTFGEVASDVRTPVSQRPLSRPAQERIADAAEQRSSPPLPEHANAEADESLLPVGTKAGSATPALRRETDGEEVPGVPEVRLLPVPGDPEVRIVAGEDRVAGGRIREPGAVTDTREPATSGTSRRSLRPIVRRPVETGPVKSGPAGSPSPVEATAEERTIEISIGRIEVNAPPGTVPASPGRRPRPQPLLTLEAYLQQRRRGSP